MPGHGGHALFNFYFEDYRLVTESSKIKKKSISQKRVFLNFYKKSKELNNS
jgi:hypothetical protein